MVGSIFFFFRFLHFSVLLITKEEQGVRQWAVAEIASFDSTLLLQAICLHNYIRLDSSCIIHFCEKHNPVSPLCLLCLTSLVFCVIKCFYEISRKPRHFTIQASAGKTFDLPDPLPLQSCVIGKGEHQRGSMRLEDLLTHQLYF